MHTPEEQQHRAARQRTGRAGYAEAGSRAESSDDDEATLDLTEMPTGALAARAKAITKQLGAHLAHLSQAGCQQQVIPLKLLSKAPRGTTAKAFHGLRASSKLVYADQVQVPWAHATFSTKERSRCAIVQELAPAAAAADADDASSGSGSQHRVFLAEPVAFYKLESGEWWVELLRFYSSKELRPLAKAADARLHLPPDFQLSYELLRGMAHEHVRLRQVQGEFKLSKVKKVPAASSRARPNPFFWRYSFDSASMQVLTDRPVTDFIVQ
ncbi:hypothetical protein OEZ85_005424 [Tetradesmus obliquus]|uniref:Uncharacterized protein n=1 Tax=Tetradesmus obliquus TaxID=3088 RepID=A0ABY8ULH5_TETOB|nr:hypothetical protein OEZ85_005424 [Tetradesmus obliquus]